MQTLKEINYEGDFCYECHGFMAGVPDDLKIKAGKFSFDIGMYLMDIYNKM